jgi:hypothetical protein
MVQYEEGFNIKVHHFWKYISIMCIPELILISKSKQLLTVERNDFKKNQN